jgi:hypothetical protein
VVPNDVGPRGRHECCQSGHEIDRLEDDVSGSVAPAVPEAIEYPAVGELREALGGDRRPRPVAHEPFEASPIARGDTDVSVEAESLDARAARARNGIHVFDIVAIAEPQDALTGERAGGDAALERISPASEARSEAKPSGGVVRRLRRRTEKPNRSWESRGSSASRGSGSVGASSPRRPFCTRSFSTRRAMAAVMRAISSSVDGGSG